MKPRSFLSHLLFLAVLQSGFLQMQTLGAESELGRWSHGPPADPGYFPIAVWLQSPRNAARFKAAGINLYVGLWNGPSAEQLNQLRQAGISVICEQNDFARQHKDDPIIVGWMHGDEPDNAQSRGRGQGYGPPITPEVIHHEYEQLRTVDSTRPVLLNLGQGVAWDNYIGRGVRRNHPEDYPKYVQGSDIVSFDIYPVVHDSPEIAGKLEYVARGVQRLEEWSQGEKIVWNCIECTHISNLAAKATPSQVRAEVWMALIHGSHGLIYFVHQFKPAFKEAALLDDPEMLAAVTRINQQIGELAPILNSSSVTNGVEVNVDSVNGAATGAPGASEGSKAIAWMEKRKGESTYLFTVNMRNEPAVASFTVEGAANTAAAKALGEGRELAVQTGQFKDHFAPYEVHLYVVENVKR